MLSEVLSRHCFDSLEVVSPMESLCRLNISCRMTKLPATHQDLKFTTMMPRERTPIPAYFFNMSSVRFSPSPKTFFFSLRSSIAMIFAPCDCFFFFFVGGSEKVGR